jgi:hypothetical protein
MDDGHNKLHRYFLPFACFNHYITLNIFFANKILNFCFDMCYTILGKIYLRYGGQKMAKNDGRETDDLNEIIGDIESLGVLDRTDFEDMEIMREDETFAAMVEEHISEAEMDELTRAFRDLEDQISAPTIAEDFASIELNEGEFGDMTEDDLDAMLKSLMEKEDDRSSWTPLENIDAQLEQEPEIYEGDGSGSEIDLSLLEVGGKTKRSVKSPRKWMLQQYRTGDKGTKALVLSIAAMSGLVAVSLLFLTGVLIASNIGRQEQGTFNIASPPPYAFNNASHSLVNLSAPLGDDTIVLSRLLLDEVATVFYFGGTLDPDRYIFALEDLNGRTYTRNVILAENPVRDQAINQTVVRFEAMDPLAEGFVISITDLHTGQTGPIGITFDHDAIAPGRHITNPLAIDTGLSHVAMSIDQGIFSAAASSLNFSISSSNPDVSLVFGENTAMPPVVLRHTGVTVPSLGTLEVSDFPQSGITLGAMDFSPLRSLTGRLDVVFSQIYKRYEVNSAMSTAGMFSPGEDRARTIELDDHIVTIHGLMRQGDFFVMPLYGMPKAASGEDAARVPVTMEVILTGMSSHPHARQIRIPGTVIYDARGTDVIFDTAGNEAILEIPRGSLYLEFESISVRLPEFSATIDLDDMSFEPLSFTDNVKSMIESAFERDMWQFAGQFGASQNVEYAVQVRQIHFEGNTAYARVTERLAFTDGGIAREVLRHHRVTANITAARNVEIVSVVEETGQRT